MPAETPLSPTTAPFDQHLVWGTWKKYCDTCHFGPKARGNVERRDARSRQSRRQRRDLGKGPAQAAQPRDAAPGRVAARRRDLRAARQGNRHRARPRGRIRSPTPGVRRFIASTARNTATPSATMLGLHIDVAELLPADDIGYGFDNIGDVLTVSPWLLERYLLAASKISRSGGRRRQDTAHVPDLHRPARARQDDRMNDDLPIGSRGGTVVEHRFPVDGEYEIAIELQRGQGRRVCWATGGRASSTCGSTIKRLMRTSPSPPIGAGEPTSTRRSGRTPSRATRSASR